MRALLVDDDPTVRSVIHRILTRKFDQLEVVECKDGAEALAELSRNPTTLMLLDLTMPVMDGFGVLERLRRTPALKSVPVIMMTGNNDEHTVRRILSVGVTDYILKPVRPLQLCERVSKVLVNAPSTEMAAPPTAPVFTPLELTANTHVVIADGHDDFREFARKSLAATCRVDAVPAGLEAFQRCLEQPPYAVFAGSHLGIVDGELLVKKLRDNTRLQGIRVIGMEPHRTLIDARKRGTFEAVIARSFMTDVFMAGVQSLTPAGLPPAFAAAVPDLKVLASDAIEDAIGSVIKSAAMLKGWNPETEDDAIAASMAVRIGDTTRMQMLISVTTRNTPRLIQILGDDDGPSSGPDRRLATMLAAVARAMSARMASRHVAFTCDEPEAAWAPRKKAVGLAMEFDVPGERVSVRVDLTVDEGAAAPTH